MVKVIPAKTGVVTMVLIRAISTNDIFFTGIVYHHSETLYGALKYADTYL